MKPIAFSLDLIDFTFWRNIRNIRDNSRNMEFLSKLVVTLSFFFLELIRNNIIFILQLTANGSHPTQNGL